MKLKTSPIAGILLVIALVTGMTAVIRASADSSPDGNKMFGTTPFIYTAETADDAVQNEQTYKLALQWAEAWKTRDGKLRLEIMSSSMQKEFRQQQKAATGDANNTVIRWSSPWVVSYIAESDAEEALITYRYTDSTGSQYLGTERLSFGEENGRTVVNSSKTEIEMKPYSEE
ncbi:hypothetical protein [Paenibacillus pedocola]|uniref:hypothetical protein n=1 Tax=Paenibacillus pedocola TaxID=3242193 RepID=UPI002877B81E|nr:hypothetical protein [Paenibacillus typhae]